MLYKLVDLRAPLRDAWGRVILEKRSRTMPYRDKISDFQNMAVSLPEPWGFETIYASSNPGIYLYKRNIEQQNSTTVFEVYIPCTALLDRNSRKNHEGHK